jgi:hypothetical protein
VNTSLSRYTNYYIYHEQRADGIYSRSATNQLHGRKLGIVKLVKNESEMILPVAHTKFISRRRAPELFLQWSTQMHQLCGENNQALFGSCLASTGKQLELKLEITIPINPGLAFFVSVVKVDFYNQTVTSDFSTFLKIHTMSAAHSHADSVNNGPSLGAIISGEAVFQLAGGRSKVSVALKPYFSVIRSDSGLALLAGEVLLYTEGVDDLSSVTLR